MDLKFTHAITDSSRILGIGRRWRVRENNIVSLLRGIALQVPPTSRVQSSLITRLFLLFGVAITYSPPVRNILYPSRDQLF